MWNFRLHYAATLSYKRISEYVSCFAGSTLLLANGYYIVRYMQKTNVLQILLITGAGMTTADFLSGLVHWLADTWGSTHIPIIGPYFLRPFREHHIEPTGITRNDVIRSNSYNMLVIVPFAMCMLYKLTKSTTTEIHQHSNWYLYLLIIGIFTSITNQIHKWSHTHSGLPTIIALLQRCHLILPQKHHRYHHIAPHETYYCITTGWLNYPLEKIKFWSTIENAVTKLTGIKPRTDDLRWAKRR